LPGHRSLSSSLSFSSGRYHIRHAIAASARKGVPLFYCGFDQVTTFGRRLITRSSPGYTARITLWTT
jgi:hypothetical protein